jgi:hypothetical protein
MLRHQAHHGFISVKWNDAFNQQQQFHAHGERNNDP